MTQAEDIMAKLRDDPRPEVQVPNIMADFKPDQEMDGFRKMEAWVYKWREENMTQEMGDDQVVKDFGNGWTIKKLAPESLEYEGVEMGHCVGGYCSPVERGDVHIYSLRDPKNKPHVTIEVSGQWNEDQGITPMSASEQP